ncbi:MAG: metal-dependent hydrolase [Candidatus Margulisbacteria bacterium]|nr:metal-dependent hydrolase [Candidatus Margulisiibacteriota bacterium]
MLAPTHSVFGLFLTLVILAAFGIKISLHWTILTFAVIGAVLPDIDHPKSLIGKLFPFISNPLERRFGHRTFTHSLLGALFFTLIFSLIILLYNLTLYGLHIAFNIKYFGLNTANYGLAIRWIAAFFISYTSHLVLDMFNKQGSQLFWPNTGRDVIPKNIKFRLESGSKAEIFIFFALLGLVLLALPISKYGFGSSLRWVLATPESAIAEYKDMKTHTFVEFKGVYQSTKENVEGLAEILDVVNKQLVVRYDNKIYSLSSDDGADIVASKVRVKHTDKPLEFRQVVFKDKTRESLLAQITTASLVSGYVELPADMQLKFPVADIKQGNYKTMQQKGDRLILSFAGKAELEKLGLNEQFLLLQKQDKTELSSLRIKKNSVLADIKSLKSQDDGLTDLGRQFYGDKEKLAERENKIAEYRSQLSELDLKIQTITLRMKEHEFFYTGEVKVRE